MKHVRHPHLATLGSCLGLLLFTGVATTGCTPKPQIPDAGQFERELGETCTATAECKVGKCHDELKKCVCTSDIDCAPLFCNAFTGTCVVEVPGCPALPCKANEWCDTSLHTCFPKKEFCETCNQDAECGTASDRCLTDTRDGNSYCGQGCSDDSTCPEGTTCQTVSGSQTCWPNGVVCGEFFGCNPDTNQACAADADCTEGTDQVCDTVQGLCVARVPTCPFGQVCSRDTKTCDRACVTDDECNLNPLCDGKPCRCTNNQCVLISLCTADADCAAGKVCIIEPGQTDGECRASCTADTDCPLGKVCTNLGARSACNDSCLSDADCNLSQNCSGGKCITGCQTNEVCQRCQLCNPVNAQVSECANVGTTYCQTCNSSAPVNSCSQNGTPPTPDSYCCNFGTGIETWGIPCGVGGSCPLGFQCFAIGSLADNCFPQGSTCTDPNCK